MEIQLLSDVVGVAIGVLLYSLFCLTCSCLMIWLVWMHHERDSYVAFLSYFTCLSTLASVIQQIHTIFDWRDVKIAQWHNAKDHPGSVEIMIAGPSVGIDLVLFYIQYYSYNVESLLTMFWAGALAATIFNWHLFDSFRLIRRKASWIAKGTAIFIPAILLSMLKVQTVQENFYGFLFLANITMMIGIGIGSIFLLSILTKYVHTKRQLLSWHVRYGQSTPNVGTSFGGISGPRKTIYDNWLLVRFTIAFVMLGLFQLFMIYFEVTTLKKNSRGSLPAQPDLSAIKARADFFQFMPGVSTSILLFVVFGTTTPFRKTMKDAFIPRRFRRSAPSTDNLPPVVQLKHKRWPANKLGPRDATETVLVPGADYSDFTLYERIAPEAGLKKAEDEFPVLLTPTRAKINPV